MFEPTVAGSLSLKNCANVVGGRRLSVRPMVSVIWGRGVSRGQSLNDAYYDYKPPSQSSQTLPESGHVFDIIRVFFFKCGLMKKL